MTARPLVSVIVPTHGRVALVQRLLDSLAAQDWPEDRYEIIVVHNFTPDGTEEAVRDRAARSPVALRYFRTNFDNPGLSRQFGADRATGDVLAFIDDDCIATPGWIAAGVAALAQGLAVVQGRTLPDPAQPRRLLEKTVQIEGPTLFFETCNIFYDAAAFRSIGGFPATFRNLNSAEDTSLGWAMRRAGHQTGYCADALVYHEVFAVSVWRWLRAAYVLENLPLVARHYPEFRQQLFLRMFLSPQTAAFDLFVLASLGGVLLHHLLLAGCLPYLVLRLMPQGRFSRAHVLLARLLFGLPRAALMLAYLVRGSVRARSLVL